MRILYFTRDYSPHDDRFLKVLSKSGIETFLLRLEGGELHSRGIELPEGIEEVHWTDGTVIDGSSGIENRKSQLERVFSKVKPDLVHAGPLPQCAYLSALVGFKPLVAMSWGYDLLNDVDKWAEALEHTEFTLSHSEVLLVDCQASAKKVQDMGFPAERIVNFPWGVDLKHFSPGDGSVIRKKLGWERNFVILCNRSWEPKYGVNLVLCAFLKAFQEDTDLRLLLVGDGSQAAQLNNMIKKSGADEFIHRPGRIDLGLLPDYYRAADLYVSASHVDGSSVSLLEAMACGKPVAVSSIPANLEWVQQGSNGWIFPDGDEAALVKMISEAVENRDRLAGFGKTNRRVTETRADWLKNSQELFHAYEIALRAEK